MIGAEGFHFSAFHYVFNLPQGINRTLLSWVKLWDETVFGHSSFASSNTSVSRPAGVKEKGGGGYGGDGAWRGGEGKRGRGGFSKGKSEWHELGDPVTFASEEVKLPHTLLH